MNLQETFTVANLIGLVTLIALEIVLGIDNIIFMAIQIDKLPPEQREKARRVGLIAAAATRILLVCFVGILMKLTTELFTAFGHGISAKDLVMIFGGAYLLWHSVKEIHEKVSGHPAHYHTQIKKVSSFKAVIVNILFLDLIFSIDSVLTAIGMIDSILLIVTAIVVSVAVMLCASGVVIRFIQTHPAVQILALSFLVLIGVLLVAEGFGQHVSKGYVYAAVLFATVVEFLQIRAEKMAKASS